MFTVTAGSGQLTYALLNNTTQSYTDKAGVSQSVKTGLRTDKVTAADTSTIVIKANDNVNLTAYVVFANMSYNSDRASTVKWTKTGGTEQTENGTDKSGKMDRTKIIAVTVALEANQTLTLHGNTTADGCLWLFGVEAEKVAE